MPLLEFWKNSPQSVESLSVIQIVATAGDGNLRDGSDCASEFRQYISNIRSEKIALYIEQCLTGKFDRSGMALQDLVNELGRRLDYKVSNGRYQGTIRGIGYDGLWISPEATSIVAEIKTTDAYRISLDTVAEYRARLLRKGDIGDNSSILIVVGRQDTGELEAQIRGSKHAWTIRLISVESLIKLVKLKENADDQETGLKIRSVLAPLGYTRLDRLVDVMFSTVTDTAPSTDVDDSMPDVSLVKSPSSAAVIAAETTVSRGWNFTDSSSLSQKREQIIRALETKYASALIKTSRALYWDHAHSIRVACTISKRYEKRVALPYWYAHHPQWDDFLKSGKIGLLVLGCMDLEIAFAIPIDCLASVIPNLNKTESEEKSYWHIHIARDKNGKLEIVIPRSKTNFDLAPYQISLNSL